MDKRRWAIVGYDHDSHTLCQEVLEHVSLVDVSDIQRRIVGAIRMWLCQWQQCRDNPHPIMVVLVEFGKRSTLKS